MSDKAWICLGGGPTAPAMLKLAQRDYPTAPVVTCNSGIKLVHPDWYFMQDKAAIRMFCTPALEKQKAGMKIFALRQTDRKSVV